MSMLDSIVSAVEQHPDVNQQQHATLVQSALEMFGNHGGLTGMLNNAQSSGLGGIVSSWISNGSNQAVSPQQVPNIVGEDRLQQIAERAGIPAGVASAALSRILPTLVDKMTPGGRLPQAA